MKSVVAIKKNSKGVTYSIQQEGEAFGVWRLCENYCRHTRGGTRRLWRYVERGMDRESAEKLFARRSK